jgi:hypothetical protein
MVSQHAARSGVGYLRRACNEAGIVAGKSAHLSNGCCLMAGNMPSAKQKARVALQYDLS